MSSPPPTEHEGLWRPRGWVRLTLGIVVALGVPALATMLMASGWLGKFPSLLYVVCIVAAALVGRLIAGLVAMAGSAVMLDYYILEPRDSLAAIGRYNAIDMLVFVLLGVLVAAVVAGTDRSRAAAQRAKRAAEIAQRRLALISEVSRMLAESFDLAGNLRAACAAVAADGGWDHVLVYTADTDRLRCLAGAQRKPGRRRRDPGDLLPGSDTFELVSAAIAARQVQILHRGAGWLAGRFRPWRYRTGLLVPMWTGSQPVGALVLLESSQARSYVPTDQVFARELGDRIASAADNARRYEQQVHIAQTLQRSLLPPSLPLIPGVDVHARYQAGGGTQVGGDFYDVFGVDDRTWMVVIGDVCGKGPEAAAVMGIARATLRALALHEPSPQRLLTLLNEALLAQVPDGRFVTACCAAVKPAAGGAQITLALAGHPPPMIRRRGGNVAAVATAYGTLLGAFPAVELLDTTVSLKTNDAIVFYTDGIETRRAAAHDRAQAMLAEHGDEPIEQITEVFAVAARSVPAADADDLVVLALEVVG